jgi:hypothetical protein
MAVYVLLSFEDDAQAKTFVKDMVEYPDSQLLTPVQENYVSAKVCGVWKRPTLFCQCTKSYGWKKGTKYGWWVCDHCGKPSRMKAHSSTEWELALGTNLLPPEVCPEPFNKRLRDWRSPVEWKEFTQEKVEATP